jgi:hypothetical protein
MLFVPARHETLSFVEWDEAVAREAIEQIVALSLQQYSPREYWPSHPLDDDGKPAVFYNLYLGAAGTIWALDYLRNAGMAPELPDFQGVFETLYETNHNEIAAQASGSNGLLIADTGLLLLGAPVTKNG